MTEGAKETRTCQKCGTEYEYIVGSSIGDATLGSAVLGSDPELCDDCAEKREGQR